MKKTIFLSLIAISFLSFSLSSDISEIETNKEIEDTITNEIPIKYYVFKTEKSNGMVKVLFHLQLYALMNGFDLK